MVRVAVPLPPDIVDGLTEQVVVPSDVDTLQVRTTLELKPPAGVTVRVALPLIPRGMVSVEVEAVRLKPALTVTGMTWLWVRVPLVAVIVTAPLEAEEDALTVSVLLTVPDGLAVTEVGFSEHVRPVVPLQEKLTVPLNPSNEVTVMVSVVEPPGLTVSLELPEVSWKSCTPMEALIVTESVLLPLVP